MDNRMEMHEGQVEAVCRIFKGLGLKARRMPKVNSPYDVLIAQRARLEIKTTAKLKPGIVPSWAFNIHRHGVLAPVSVVDFFVLVIPPVPQFDWKTHTRLCIPAKDVGELYTVNISPRTLITRWGVYRNQWSRVIEFCKATNQIIKLGPKLKAYQLNQEDVWTRDDDTDFSKGVTSQIP